VRVHLVDGTFELFRAHYSPASPDRLSPEGVPVKATVGLVGSLLNLLHSASEDVTHIAVAFDNPIRSFRNDLFPAYKSDEGVPPELRAQFDIVETATRALGITVWSMDEWEADDALATAAVRFAPVTDQVRIMTPDKDLGQCVVGSTVVQVDRMRDREVDEAGVIARFGVPPRAIVDYLALVGDSSDGFPGIAGFGAKTAAALLSVSGRLEDIPEDPAAWPSAVRSAPRLAVTLAEHWADALLYRKLATLVTDVPLAEDLDDLTWHGVPRAPFEDWCDAIGVSSMRTRPTRWSD